MQNENAKEMDTSVQSIATKEAELTAAEAALKGLNADVNVKLGPIPFIAGVSNKVAPR